MRGLQFVSYLVLYCWNGGAEAANPDSFAAYMAAEISQCELRNLQSFWKLSTQQETKIAIGTKVLAKQDLLPDIKNARTQALQNNQPDCDWSSLDFEYRDAEVMAGYWGTDTYNVKLKIANEVAASSQYIVKKKLATLVPPVETVTPDQVKADPVDTFFAQGYDYCHAKMVAKAYGQGTYETKTWLGGFLQRGDKGLVEHKLVYARKEALKKPANACSFSDTSFTAQDAQKLAQMWNMTYAETKTTLANKYLYGIEKDMMNRLR